MDHLFHELVQFVLQIDAFVVDLVVELRHPLLTKVMNSVTGLGSAAAGVVFLGLFYLANWKREFDLTLLALILSGLIVGSLMIAVQRPFPPHPICVTGGSEMVAHSFPSGHAAAVTVYAMVAYRSEILPFVITAVFALLIAFSRIYLGTHYLSDTVVGILIGIGTVLVAVQILESERFQALF